MDKKEIEKITKVLNDSLRKEFDFVDRIINVTSSQGTFFINIKFKIILNKEWVLKNFTKDALEEVKRDYEYHGHVLLSPFVMGVYTDYNFDEDNLKNSIQTIIEFLGFRSEVTNIDISFYID